MGDKPGHDAEVEQDRANDQHSEHAGQHQHRSERQDDQGAAETDRNVRSSAICQMTKERRPEGASRTGKTEGACRAGPKAEWWFGQHHRQRRPESTKGDGKQGLRGDSFS